MAIAASTLVASLAVGCSDDDSSEFTGGPSTDAGCTGFGCTSTGEGGRPGCVGTECAVVDCTGKATKTTLTGTVFDPAGKVPLYNVLVYVARTAPEPITLGLGPKCDTCAASVSGGPFAITTTDTKGNFRLEDVPSGIEFQLVMQIGKWRRIVPIPAIDACAVAAADPVATRLPRNRREGDIPRIALTTGSADALECLLKKVGLDDSEFGTANSEARIHLYEGASTEDPTTTHADKATAAFQGGGGFAKAPTLWNSVDALKKYDVVLLSCEGSEHAETKATGALQSLHDYANLGGRVFASHYHHYWFSHSPVANVRSLATWVNDGACTGPSCSFPQETSLRANATPGTINTSFAKGAAMKEWLKSTGALAGPNETLLIQDAKHNVDAVTPNLLSWMTIQNPDVNRTAHEYVSFNTPVGATDEQVCGRVVYNDLHVGAGDTPGPAFPTECKTQDLSPQQRALEFMLFDLSSCIQRDDRPPAVPR